ncbi:hypothetical protein Rsub_07510 [Raphidocelis subcapitata]|uniref:Uncharacterized protein n=1 Tax=Raphidocelis subcapitata TaxID=307507 RepID=A0A2V0P606_9CHLO|nr:hypothetical protein Rsub_07510 [Raphidocelis subcapitata]|eukprot:GBF95009.1 hypothetical protein Rsub_07510 [Raphidocelis subcapitata]
MVAEDAVRISELEAAHAAARAAAIDAVLGLPPGTTAARARAAASGGGGAGSGGGCEIEPADGSSSSLAAAGAGGPVGEADEFADVVRGAGAGGGRRARGNGGGEVAAAGGGGGAGVVDEPLWKQQLRQAAKDTLHRCSRITILFVVLWAVMWAMNALPHQQSGPGAAMEARFEEMKAAIEARRAAQAAAAAVVGGDGGAAAAVAAAGGGHTEL